MQFASLKGTSGAANFRRNQHQSRPSVSLKQRQQCVIVRAAEAPEKSAEEDASPKVIEIADTLSGLTLLEASQLAKVLEERFGVDASAAAAMPAMPMMMAAPGGGDAGAAAPAEEPKEEKKEFNIVLEAIDAKKKIAIIKELRAQVADLGMKEAKDLAESAPKCIKESVPKTMAEEIKQKLEAAGATVKLE